MALVCIFAVGDYPAFGRAATLSADWMVPILVRNVLSAWLICGLWDWFLYFSPLKQKASPVPAQMWLERTQSRRRRGHG